jgi:hypothetical protein
MAEYEFFENFSKISVLNFFLEKIHNKDPSKKSSGRRIDGPYMLLKFQGDNLSLSIQTPADGDFFIFLNVDIYMFGGGPTKVLAYLQSYPTHV